LEEIVYEIDFQMSKKDFKFFFEDICGWQLADHHAKWVKNLQTHNRYCVKASRDHGKSVCFLSYLLWKVCFVPGTDAMIFSHSLDQTIRHMRFLNDMIDSIPMLAVMKKRDSWAKTYFGFTNGSRITAKSVGGGVRGAHPDIVLCDDILWGTTDTELKRVASWFYEVLVPCLHHTAQLCIVGTPFTPTDLYTELEAKPGYKVETYPAINPQGEPLWPERWDLDALDSRRKDMPAVAFTREYLCEPIDDASSLFPSSVMALCESRNHVLLNRKYTDTEGNHDDQYYIGWDPAISSDRAADYTVMTVLRRPSEEPNKLEIVHITRRKGMDFRTQIMEIQRLNSKFRPEVIELEANHFQRVFATELRANTDLPIKTFISSKTKRESMLMGLVLKFEREQMVLPMGDENSRNMMVELKQELLLFGMSKKGKLESIGRHDDMVISLALAHWATTEFQDRIVDLDEIGESVFPESVLGM
jgi:hypothetical protein